MAITQEIENKPSLTAAELLKILSSTEGQQLLAAANRMQLKVEAPSVKAHTPDEIAKFYKLAEKDDFTYIRIDPTTQKPHAEAKEFLWRIKNAFPAFIGTAKVRETGNPTGAVRIQFQIQKFWRNKMVKRPKDPMADPSLPLSDGDSIEDFEPWVLMDPEGGLAETGDPLIDASDFVIQFKREE